jgi:hypothetical protein
MLQLIILGQIPGTHIQITFSYVLLCLAASLGFGFFWRHNHAAHNDKDTAAN